MHALGKILAACLFVLLLLAGAAFGYLNSSPVVVDYLIGRLQLTLAGTLLLALFVGMVIGYLVGSLGVVRAKLELRRLRRECRSREQEQGRSGAHVL